MNYYREYHFAPDEVLIYLRKSRQDDPNQTVEEVLSMHRQILDNWVSKNMSGPIPEENIYMERVSGETIKDRVEIKKVLSKIETPYIKAVLVVEPQRLSRGDLEDAGRIINAFRYSNTIIITPNRYYDLQDEADCMFFEMELKQGNQFLEYTKRIMARGRLAAAERGEYLSNRTALGYDKITVNKMKTLIPNDKAPVVHQMYEMCNEGHGLRSICTWLDNMGIKTKSGKPWDRESVRYILQNVLYIGKIKYRATKVVKQITNGEVIKKKVKTNDYIEVDGLHDAIVEEALFYSVQERLKTRPHTKVGTELKNPFAGLVRCKNCNKMIALGKTHGGEYYLYCQSRHLCKNGSVSLRYVIDAVCESLEGEIERFYFEAENNTVDMTESYNELINSLERQIAELDEKELKQWKDRYENENPMPEHIFRKLNEELNEKRTALKSTLRKELENPPQQVDYKKKIIQFTEALDALKNEEVPASEKNELLKQCIQIIYYNREVGRLGNSYSLQKRPFSLEIEFVL